jgi:hypothetical protein
VLFALYSAIVSRDIASREYWSFLPLYLSWIFLIFGAISIMRRWFLIIRSVTGISADRTTMTRPRIDRIQVMPAFGSRPTSVHTQWNPVSRSSISHLIGHRTMLMVEMNDAIFMVF